MRPIAQFKPFGKIREIRPGQFQLYFTYNGKRYSFQRGIDRKPLHTHKEAALLQTAIIPRTDGGTFNADGFRKNKIYALDYQIKEWIKLSNCSSDYLKKRKRMAEEVFIPFFEDTDVRQLRAIQIKEFHKTVKHKNSPKTQKNILGELKAFLQIKRWIIYPREKNLRP